ncbi:hypothetical protein GCM10009092_35020 [Bowmanella denitrificans]|uniref:N-acetyltransferase domain-containing protein n=2 Tax=Bowmanella denitrificans TaxID=366582 RepID=A0ABN0XM79_9ALTE
MIYASLYSPQTMALHGETSLMNLVKLWALHQKDRAAVMLMLGESRVMRFLGPRRALSEDEAGSWFKAKLDNPSRFVIADAESDEFIGFCGIKEIAAIHRRGQCGQ